MTNPVSQKAVPRTFHQRSPVHASAFSDCDRKLELVNQTLTSTSMKEFRSNICATFCDTSQEPLSLG
eukprot:s3577_g4.t1